MSWLSELDSNAIKHCLALQARVKEFPGFFLLEFDSSMDALAFALHCPWNRFPVSRYESVPYTRYHMSNRFLLGIEHLRDYAPDPPRKNLFLVKPEYERASEKEIRKLHSTPDYRWLSVEQIRQIEEIQRRELPRDLIKAIVKKPESYVTEIRRSAEEEGLSEDEYAISYSGPGEVLYNILAGFILKRDGWIVFPEGTLASLLDVGGSPDMVAVKIPDFQEYLVSQGMVEETGFWLAEVQLGPSKIMPKAKIYEGTALVLEGESSSKSVSAGKKQLDMYTAPGLFEDKTHFNGGILIAPNIIAKQAEPYGVISWNEEGTLLKKVRLMWEKPDALDAISMAVGVLNLHIQR